MCFVYKYSVFLTVPAYLQCQDENIQQARSFFVFKISWTISSDWLHLTFHSGTENREEKLKEPSCKRLGPSNFWSF